MIGARAAPFILAQVWVSSFRHEGSVRIHAGDRPRASPEPERHAGKDDGHFQAGACRVLPEYWTVFYEHYAFPVFEGFR